MATYIEKDPSAKLSYGFKWADWLTNEGRTIEDSTWTVQEGITEEGEALLDSETEEINPGTTVADSLALVRLSGGTAGHVYRCINDIELDNGDEEQRTLLIKVVDR